MSFASILIEDNIGAETHGKKVHKLMELSVKNIKPYGIFTDWFSLVVCR